MQREVLSWGQGQMNIGTRKQGRRCILLPVKKMYLLPVKKMYFVTCDEDVHVTSEDVLVTSENVLCCI